MDVGVVVDVEWLAHHRTDPGLTVVDARPPHFYITGHIENAVNLPPFLLVAPGGGTLAPAEFAQRMATAGMHPDTLAVLYDEGSSPAAALCWRIFAQHGQAAAVLDGGIPAWAHAGYPLAVEQTQPERSHYPVPEFRHDVSVDMAAVMDALGDVDAVLLDTRSPAEFMGQQSAATRDGHIPGAVNVDWSNNLARAADGLYRMRSDAELRELYAAVGATPDKHVITYCQSGGRASETYLILKKLGYPHVSVYTPGWQEWGNRYDTPVEGP